MIVRVASTLSVVVERQRLGIGGAPAVVERDALLALEAPGGVGDGAASLARRGDGRHIHDAEYSRR